MATDIFEKDMKATRNARWDKVFHSKVGTSLDDIEFRNLKATIVIEHIVSLYSSLSPIFDEKDKLLND